MPPKQRSTGGILFFVKTGFLGMVKKADLLVQGILFRFTLDSPYVFFFNFGCENLGAYPEVAFAVAVTFFLGLFLFVCA